MGEENTKGKKHTGLWVALIVSLLALVAAYVAAGMYFEDHFFLGTTVNGVNVAGYTTTQALSAMNVLQDRYELTLVGMDGRTETLHSADLGMKMNISEEDLKLMMNKQYGFAWPMGLISPNSFALEDTITADPVAVKRKIPDLELVKKHTVETQDAYIDFGENEYIVASEVYGDQIDQKVLNKALLEAANGYKHELNLKDADCYIKPTVFSDDAKLNKYVNELNKYVKPVIKYELGDEDYIIEPAIKAKWVSLDENNEVIVDEEAIADFVDDIAEKYTTLDKDKTLISSADGSKVTIPAGNFGWKVNKTAEYKQLLEDFYSGKDVNRELVYSQRGVSHGENDYGDSYVEVNITEQHVWLYKDGKLVLDTDCVTGNLRRGTITHVGAYKITYKKSPAILRGADYTTPVTYWMPFHNGEGLHDATWRGRFGGDIYTYDGSHGCVNLPKKAAATIYENVEEGFPVLVYKPEKKAEKPEPEKEEEKKEEEKKEEEKKEEEKKEEEKKPATTQQNSSTPEQRISKVIKAIDAIGYDEGAWDSIKAARAAYGALSDEEKNMVSNADQLWAKQAYYIENYGYRD